MCAVSVCQSVCLARAVRAGSFGAAFAESLWPLAMYNLLYVRAAKLFHFPGDELTQMLRERPVAALPGFLSSGESFPPKSHLFRVTGVT